MLFSNVHARARYFYFKSIMNIKKLSITAAFSALTFTTTTNAVLGPIPIYLNTEYRTGNPVVSSIASKTVFTKEDIQKTGATTFLQLLEHIPSVTIMNAQGNVPALYVRGTDENHILLLIDGVKSHTLGEASGRAELDNVPFDQIERVELVKGPFSSLYGTGAIGGVLQIFTKQSFDTKESGSVSISYGSNNTTNYTATATHQFDGNFINANVSKFHTDGISAKSGNSEKDHQDRTSAELKFKYIINDKNEFLFDILDSEYEQGYDNSSTSSYENYFKKKDLTKIHAKVNSTISDTWKYSLSASQINQTRQYIKNNVADPAKKYKTIDLTWLNDFNVNSDLVTLGLSKVDDKNTTDSKSLSHKDIFGQWQGSRNNMGIVIGGRVIDHSDYGNHNTYNIALSKDLTENNMLSFSYGNAFNSPSLFQLHDPTYGDSTLKPEKSKSYEIGLTNNDTWADTSVKIYKTTIKDMIDWDGGYKNITKVNIKGLDFSLTKDILGWKTSVDYNFNQAREEGSELQLKRRPRHSVGITTNKQIGKTNHNFSIVRKSKRRDSGILSSYTLANYSALYGHNKDWSIGAKINNAFDKKYTLANGSNYEYNQLGRNIHLEVTKKF